MVCLSLQTTNQKFLNLFRMNHRFVGSSAYKIPPWHLNCLPTVPCSLFTAPFASLSFADATSTAAILRGSPVGSLRQAAFAHVPTCQMKKGHICSGRWPVAKNENKKQNKLLAAAIRKLMGQRDGVVVKLTR